MLKSRNQKEREVEEARLDAHLAKVRFFPGSQAEYEAHVGYQVRVIDTGHRDIGVMFHSEGRVPYRCLDSFEHKKILVAEGVEALVGCSLGMNRFVSFDIYKYGLPVAKK